MVRGGLREKVAFEQAQRAQPMQRPWGRTVPGMLEEQRGGPCVWSRVSEGERGRRGGQGGDWARHTGPCGQRGGLGLLPHGRWEPWRVVGRGGDGA